MKLSIRFVSDATSNPPPQLDTRRTLIRWDHPIALRDGYGTPNRLNPSTGELVGQFAMCPLHITDQAGVWEGTWAENTMATRLTHDELQQIAALQVADTFTVKMKMNWLCTASAANGWGSPINTNGEDYTVAINVKMIAAVYAGQPVELTGETMTRQIDLHGNKNFELLHRVKAYNPSQWTRDNCQLVTAVSKDNVYTENTKGRIVLPVYFGDRKAFVLDRWLV